MNLPSMENGIKPTVWYRLPYSTEEEIKIAEDLRSELYEQFESVLVFPQGSHSVIIEATNNI